MENHVLFQIPLLNTITNCAMYNKKLVRFRGMIQDILNPVYYMEKFKVRNLETDTISYRSGRYWDFIDIRVGNYLIYYCISFVSDVMIYLFWQFRDMYLFMSRIMKRLSPTTQRRISVKNILCTVFKCHVWIHGLNRSVMITKLNVVHLVLPSQFLILNTFMFQFRFVDDQSNVTKREGKRKLSQNDTEMDVEENILQDQSWVNAFLCYYSLKDIVSLFISY